MPGWIPRWHPFVWIIVIALIWAIVADPTGMAGRAGGIIHDVEHVFRQLGVFFESI
jgi:hypothetical protein